jgi:hypothetical protein
VKTLASFARVAAGDLFARGAAPRDPREHLDAAVRWLERAHDRGGAGGVSYGYCLRGGWRPPYRETSGYIASTFFDVAEQLADPDCRVRAIDIAKWLCTVQNPDGSIANPRYGPGGIVFDTGQVLEGYVRAHRETGDPAFLDAARRAGDWLVAVADGEGRWTRSTFRGVPHVYNTRTAWPLLALHAIAPRADYQRVARANLDFALEQQRANGWFDQCGFEPGAPPFTHTIAYAIEGLVGAGALLREPRYTDAAQRAARAALAHVREDGFVPGRIGTDDRPGATYACLTGSCQLALVWARLFAITGEEPLRDAAVRALRYAMRWQPLDTADPDVRGAIKGSQPVWGGYSPLAFPNWAAKFFIDAMLLGKAWL